MYVVSNQHTTLVFFSGGFYADGSLGSVTRLVPLGQGDMDLLDKKKMHKSNSLPNDNTVIFNTQVSSPYFPSF